jgi:hypothetical protein
MPRKFSGDFFSRPRGPSNKSAKPSADLFARSQRRELGFRGAAAWWNTCGVTNLSSRPMGSTLRDRTGEKHGRLTVVKRGPNKGKKTVRWWCECSCGRACVLVHASNLGKCSMSCGCWREEECQLRKGSKRLAHPTPGTVFGRWTVLAPAADIGYPNMTCTSGMHYEPASLVRCGCGSGVEKPVLVKSLVRGLSQSCGCIKGEGNNLRHGHAKASGQSSIYGRYIGMVDRCHNPSSLNWPDYGGRGITVCERWLAGFEYFLEDMGTPPTADHQLDRRDNNAGYSPENCRWVTRSENCRNRRSTIAVETRKGSFLLVEACELLHISYQHAWRLHRSGLLTERLERALEVAA